MRRHQHETFECFLDVFQRRPHDLQKEQHKAKRCDRIDYIQMMWDAEHVLLINTTRTDDYIMYEYDKSSNRIIIRTFGLLAAREKGKGSKPHGCPDSIKRELGMSALRLIHRDTVVETLN